MRRKAVLIPLCLLIPLGMLFARAGSPGEQPNPPGQEEGSYKLFSIAGTSREARLLVTRGSEQEALDYYKAITPAINLANLPASKIDDMLRHFGYSPLTAEKVEAFDPQPLMSTAPPGFILAVRFFAPKIVDVSEHQKPNEKYGWRKVVRFKARPKSPAEAAGLDSFFLLFNFVSKDPVFPGGHAGQIQAMLTPVYPHGGKHRDAYFLVYKALQGAEAGKIGTFLQASFDFGNGAQPGVNDKYFVPRSCGQCHGTTRSDQQKAKVNYLDTDHWLDRVQKGDDFSGLPAANVLVDGPPSFTNFRALNQEILQQSTAVDPDGFARRAAARWIELHRSNDQHVPALLRGITVPGRPNVWKPEIPQDAKLLPLLNRYCFRCHSSINFHVFEKEAVCDRRSEMASYVDLAIMPQDRKLSKEAIADLISSLRNITCR